MEDNVMETKENTNVESQKSTNTKFCKFCGKIIDMDAVLCIHCGKQVEELKVAQPQVVINNSNTNSNINTNAATPYGVKPKNKWVALVLCIFLGWFGFHKFYEGKILLGIVYLFTGGLFLIGNIFDFVCLLFKPNPYY